MTTYSRDELMQIIIDALAKINNSGPLPEKELTQKEIIKELRISKPTLIKWQNANLIPFFRVPGTRTIRYYKSEVLAAINQNRKLIDRNHYKHLADSGE